MKNDNELSRRGFIQRIGVLGAAGLGAGALLSACGGGSGEAETAEFSCADVSALTPQELQTRQAQNYTDDSPHEDQVCDNCQFWQPAAEGEQCGGCTVIKGPIHPKGYCDLWTEVAG